ncbi:hypothetical protein YC2023_091807 [Brassica napus]
MELQNRDIFSGQKYNISFAHLQSSSRSLVGWASTSVKEGAGHTSNSGKGYQRINNFQYLANLTDNANISRIFIKGEGNEGCGSKPLDQKIHFKSCPFGTSWDHRLFATSQRLLTVTHLL